MSDDGAQTERTRATASQKRARWVGLIVLALLGLGLCTLRIGGMREARDEAYDDAVTELAAALATDGEPNFEDAREAADHLARTGATLLDARATFVLKVVDDVERLAGEPEPPADASRYERIAWLIGERRLDDALGIVRDAQTDPDLDPERLALYESLLVDLIDAGE